MSVTQIGSDTMIKVNLNGKRYRLCDVYKYFDVSDSTVRKRYKEGLRGPELIHGKGVYEYGADIRKKRKAINS